MIPKTKKDNQTRNEAISSYYVLKENEKYIWRNKQISHHRISWALIALIKVHAMILLEKNIDVLILIHQEGKLLKDSIYSKLRSTFFQYRGSTRAKNIQKLVS